MEIGKQGGVKLLEDRGREYFSSIGKRGGASTKRAHGTSFYAEIGRVGGSRPKPKTPKRRGPGKIVRTESTDTAS